MSLHARDLVYHRANTVDQVMEAAVQGVAGIEFDMQFEDGQARVAHDVDEPGEQLFPLVMAADRAGMRLFAEIKPERATEAGVKHALDVLRLAREKVTVLCWRWEWLDQARAAGFDVGWVVYEPTPWALGQTRERRPQLLVVDYENWKGTALWPGPWDWMMYGVPDVSAALRFKKRGVRWIQSKNPAALL